MNSRLKTALAIAFLAWSSALWAQVTTSSITGTVQDPSGAVIAGAHVTAANEATGLKYEQDTSSAGVYNFNSVVPGQYSISISKAGFKNFSSVHNALTVGQPLVVDAHLDIGASTETVQVESSYQRIETSNAQVSDVITERQVKALPLNGRNPLSLLTIEPGVVQRTTSSSGSGTHVFGSRDRAHNVTIDGIDANESTVPNPQSNIQRITPDNTQEFRTVTLDATAETGRNSGANVMVATKTGSNALHGDAFWFHRNTVLNANEWFNNYEGLDRPALRLHQFGGDVGGPVVIPHLYNGKDKTFFFVSYQRSQIFQTEPISATGVGLLGAPQVYTPTLRQGIFRFVRGTVMANGKAYSRNSPALVDASGNLLPGIPLCGGGLTTNCIDSYNIFDPTHDPQGIGGDPQAVAFARSLPMPNSYALGDGLNFAPFNWNPPSKFIGPGYMFRVDHQFGPNDNLFVRYLQSYYNTEEGDFLNSRPEVYPGYPPLGEVGRTGKNMAASWRHTFSPNLVNEFTLGFNRFLFDFTFGESNPNFGDPTKVPIWQDDCIYGSMQNQDPPYCVSPHTQRGVTTPQLIDNLSYSHGKHNLRLGINFRQYYHNDSRGFFGGQIMAPGILFRQSLRPSNFTGISTTGVYSGDVTNLQQTIVELAGIPARIQQGFVADFTADKYQTSPYATVYTRAHQYDFYVQDEWHATTKLTVNGGLRWEYNPPPFDAKQTLVPDRPVDGSQGPVTYVKASGWYKNSNLGSVGPRLGVAYSPDQKTVLRVGYAWLFDTISTFQVTAMAGKVPGFALNCVTTVDKTGKIATASAGCSPATGILNRISQGVPTSVPAPNITPSAALLQPNQPNGVAPSVGAFDPNLKNPSVHEWDVTVQRELPWSIVGEVGYVGKRGTHLYRAYDLNQIGTNQPGFLDSFNLARANVFAGCKADGTGCTGGGTGQTPTLLLQLAGSTFLNSTTSSGDLKMGNIGNMAVRIDQQATSAGGQQIVANGFAANYFRPNPQYTQIFYQDAGGDSYYHGLFVGLRRRFEQGLTFGLSYTYSKSIDDMSIDPTGASTGGGLSTTGSNTPIDIHNWRLNRAVSDFNDTHVLQSNLVYELPFGKGKPLAGNAPGWLNQIIGGWMFTGIFNYQSGEPYSLQSGERTSNSQHVSFANIEGPLTGGGLHFVPDVEGPVMWATSDLVSNPADPHYNCRNVLDRAGQGTSTWFCIPPPGQTGGARNAVWGPSFWNLDSGLTKNFRLTERFNLQFRSEFFNVLNHTNFNNPRNASSGSPTLTSSAFGETCCTAASLPSSATVIAIGEPNRVVQFGLKLIF